MIIVPPDPGSLDFSIGANEKRMATPELLIPRRKPAAQEVSIDWNHPYTKGLIHAFLTSRGEGDTNLVTGDKTIKGAAATPSAKSGFDENGRKTVMDSGSNSDYVRLEPVGRTGPATSVMVGIKVGGSCAVHRTTSVRLTIWYFGDELYAFLHDGASFRIPETASTGPELTQGRFYVVCLTYDGSDAKLYVDGAEVASRTGFSALTDQSGTQVRFGGDGGVGGNVDGYYFAYEWDRGLSPGEVARLSADPYQIVSPGASVPIRSTAGLGEGFHLPNPQMENPALLLPKRLPVGKFKIDDEHPLANGLRGCWLLHESGQDRAINLVTGKMAVKGSTTPTYQPDRTLFDNATDRFLDYDDILHSQQGAYFTRFNWSSSRTGSFPIAGRRNLGVYETLIRVNASASDFFQLTVTGGGSLNGATALGDGVHVCGANFSSNRREVFYNGRLDNSIGGASVTIQAAEPFAIGSRSQPSPTGFFPDGIDLVYFWNRPLSYAEHRALAEDPYQFLVPA